MAILKIRDADGNIQEILAIKGEDGKDGKDYVLTEADKQEIAEIVTNGMVATIGDTPDVDLSNYYTKAETDTAIREAVESIVIPDVSAYQTEEQVLALIRTNMPVSGDGESY